MTWDDHRSALGHVFSDGHVQNPVERSDFAINAAAAAQIYWRIDIAVIDVACCDHIGTPEKYDAVAIGNGVRHVENLYRLIVGEAIQRVLVDKVRINRGIR